MDNIITGAVGMIMFLLFIGGLAHSIGAAPFVIIVIFISGLALYDFYENVRDARREAMSKAVAANSES